MRYLNLVLLFFIMSLITNSCMITDNSSFSITINNNTNVDVQNILIGKISIGTVLKGQVVTYKYFEEENNASVSIPGFYPYLVLLKGKIDLKTGYVYTVNLTYEPNIKEFQYNISGIYYNNSERIITMK